MTDLGPLLDLAHEALDLARPHFLKRPKTVTLKTERDMVTDIDKAIESELRTFLRERAPHVGFLGEEEGSDRPDLELMWALDPVDGTANFVHGVPLVAVSLGLIQTGEQILGAIDLPFLSERYTSVKGGGAANRAGRISVRTTSDLSSAIVSIGDYAVGPEAQEKNRLRFALTVGLAERVQRVRMFGSAAIDLAWVAEGKLDACIMLSNNPWDTAAGVAIAREAGALVVDLDGTTHTADSRATIAVAPGIAEEFLAFVQGTTDATI
jgi:myo-inositol-1(or 4)-monophosphatase